MNNYNSFANTLINNSHDAAIAFRVEHGEICFVNKKFESLWEYKNDEITGRCICDLFHKSDPLLKNLLNHDISSSGFVLTALGKTGKKFQVNVFVHSSSIGGEKYSLLFATSVLNNVKAESTLHLSGSGDKTEEETNIANNSTQSNSQFESFSGEVLLSNEERIEKSEMLFRKIWEHSFDGLYLLNGKGRIVMVNNAFCKLVGKPREEVQGKNFEILFAKDFVASHDFDELKPFMFSVKSTKKRVTLWNGVQIWLE
ncbi:MAG: PAS domain S-box protein, partial [Bacteroidota bacterium]|nr:PAS domain S-box protein [Bacteroidota bacterium]